MFQLTKLQNEETLRQEFASLRFLITEKEQQMWNDLEQVQYYDMQFLIRVFDIICRILNLIYNCIFDITGIQNAKSKDSSTTKSY